MASGFSGISPSSEAQKDNTAPYAKDSHPSISNVREESPYRSR